MMSFYNLFIEHQSAASSLVIILAWLVYAFILWRVFKNSSKKSFDFSVIGLLITLIFNRFFYIIFYAEQFTSNYWSVYPYSWKEGYRILFDTKPWIIFAFWKGEWDLRIFLLSFIVSILIVNLFYKEHLIRLFNNILKAVISAYLVLLILVYDKSLYIGREILQSWGIKFFKFEGKRHPLQGYIFLLSIISIVIIFLMQRRVKWVEKINGYIWGFLFFLTNATIMYYYGENIPNYIILWNVIFAMLSFIVIIIVLLGQFINYKDIIGIGKRTERVVRKQRKKKNFGDFSKIV